MAGHYGNWEMTIILAAPPRENPAIMRISGKLVVLAIFAVALAMAGFALWWNWGLGRRSLAFWGTEGGVAIRDAEKIELLRLRLKKGRGQFLNLEAFDVAETKDISKAPGVVHARHSLLEDASFDWKANLVGHSEYESDTDFFAVRFSHPQAVTTIVFLDSDSTQIFRAESGDEVALSPKTAAGWTTFLRRYFPEASGKSSQSLPAKAN
jgi:hypothetical protein